MIVVLFMFCCYLVGRTLSHLECTRYSERVIVGEAVEESRPAPVHHGKKLILSLT